MVDSLGDRSVRMKNGFYYILGLGMGLIILTLAQSNRQEARLIACDVGQGDGILIIKGEIQVLIDGGPSSEKILSCLSRYMPFWDRSIELIVLTNTDFDHMNGLSSVLNRYTVIQFVTSDGVHESDSLERLRGALREVGVGVTLVEQGDKVVVGGESGVELKVLWPPEVIVEYGAVFGDQLSERERKQILGASARRGDLNERSVVLLLLEDTVRVLLMGDAGFQAEKQLLKEGVLEQYDYLKVGHHGSKYASSLEFLERVRPKKAIISAGVKNRYGHPTSEAIERVQSVGAEIYRTDQLGDVVLNLSD